MKQTEEIKDLLAALSKFQGEVDGVSKDHSNAFTKKKYATIASCWETVRKPLSDNGLTLIQSPGYNDQRIDILTTILAHSSGQWISDEMAVTSEKGQGMNMAQSYGSGLTYARRYAMMAMLGLAAVDDDDDGRGAGSPDNKSGKATIKPASKSIAKTAPPAEVVHAKAKDKAETKVVEKEVIQEESVSIVDKAKAEIDDKPKVMSQTAWDSIRTALKQFELTPDAFHHWTIKTLRANNLIVPDNMDDLTIAAGSVLWKVANASNKAGELLELQPQ